MRANRVRVRLQPRSLVLHRPLYEMAGCPALCGAQPGLMVRGSPAATPNSANAWPLQGRMYDTFSLRYRDYPHLPKFVRHRTGIAMMSPPTDEAKPAAQSQQA